MVSMSVVESKINELNDILNDDCISKKFYLYEYDYNYYLIDENETIYERGNLYSIYKAVCMLLIFYCEISA